MNPAVREHDLKVVPCDEPALVNVDARLMVRLVVNLVNNAVTYTPAGSPHRDFDWRRRWARDVLSGR